jgi:hypothetical protein
VGEPGDVGRGDRIALRGEVIEGGLDNPAGHRLGPRPAYTLAVAPMVDYSRCMNAAIRAPSALTTAARPRSAPRPSGNAR